MNFITPNSKTALHVAVISFPLASHPSTLFTVAEILANSAPLATFSFICSLQSFSSLSQHSLQIPNLKLCNGLKVEGENYDEFFKNMPQFLRDGIDTAVVNEGGLRVTCIVSDGLMPDVGKIAREMNVAWIPVRFCGPAMVLSHFYCNELKQAYTGEESDKFIDVSSGLSIFRFKDIPDFILSGDVTPLNRGTAEEYLKADAVILNTFEGLDRLIDLEFKYKFKRYLPIGPTVLLAPPPLLPEDDRCMAWLDQHKKDMVIYICFGTYNSPSTQELAELANALLEMEDVPFLWSLPEKDRKELPSGFANAVNEERGMLVNWAPQGRVLKHEAVGAFLTHGGWNSVMEGIAGGVPMICRPFRWDQMMNVRMVSDVYKIGATVNEREFRKEEIVKMVGMVMMDEVGKEMRCMAAVYRDMAEKAVGKEGSSSRNLNSVVEIIYKTS